jgi:regulator of sigma E protease
LRYVFWARSKRTEKYQLETGIRLGETMIPSVELPEHPFLIEHPQIPQQGPFNKFQEKCHISVTFGAALQQTGKRYCFEAGRRKLLPFINGIVFMEYVIMIGQLMLSLSLLIILHEMGHFFPARMFGTRVEKFYLFFDPWFSLFKVQKGETEYGIGWLPLGGYVKISGMIDESMDTEAMKLPPQPWEFRSKPAWQRLIIMIGGVTVNFILGFLIFAGVLFTWGEQYLPAENAEYGIHADSLGLEIGLQNGDQILSIAGEPFDKFSDRSLVRSIVINGADRLEVSRNGQEQTIDIDPRFVGELASYKNKNRRLFVARVPFVVGKVLKGRPAAEAGFMENDSVVGINGQSLVYFDQFLDYVKPRPNQMVTVSVIREGAPLDIEVTTDENGQVGLAPYGADRFFDLQTQEYSLGEALPAGVVKGWTFLADQMKAFKKIITNEIPASESLGGFASIGSMFGTTWDWERFWTMTAILSLILAFMNLLPIPALDGGHVMFLLYEVVTGRKPSDKFMEIATMVGFVLILALLVYANGLDIMPPTWRNW